MIYYRFVAKDCAGEYVSTVCYASRELAEKHLAWIETHPSPGDEFLDFSIEEVCIFPKEEFIPPY